MNNVTAAMLVYEDNPIVFGIDIRESYYITGKKYLYPCRQNKYSPSFRVRNSKINTVLLIETMIAKSNNKLETHNMKWSKYKSD